MRKYIKILLRLLFLTSFARMARKAGYALFDTIVGKGFYLYLKLTKGKGVLSCQSKVKKILIIRLDRIGDVVLSTAAIRALRQHFPETVIHFMVTEYTKDIIIGNPNIDAVRVYGKDSLERDYDIAIALHPGMRQNYLTFISGAQIRIGYASSGGGFFLTQIVADNSKEPFCHEVELTLKAVEVLGCTLKEKYLQISKSEKADKFIQHLLNGLGISSFDFLVIIHPGARQEYLRWNEGKFSHIAWRLMREKKAKIIIIGTPQERKLVEKVCSGIPEKPFYYLDLTLSQLISLLSKGKLFIGNSTGPMHIAAALGIPVVAIFGPQHPKDSYLRWGPWSQKSIVVSRETGCSNCLPSECRGFKCLQSVSEDDVWVGIETVLNK
jgi:ADP-heptose:LPS heptosyltransferase